MPIKISVKGGNDHLNIAGQQLIDRFAARRQAVGTQLWLNVIATLVLCQVADVSFLAPLPTKCRLKCLFDAPLLGRRPAATLALVHGPSPTYKRIRTSPSPEVTDTRLFVKSPTFRS